ncbi:MAG: hypothetical protein HY978_02250 [Candidatus Liptonbacteria bacterium]|nr:hypothetical protein [Candidatus Liptonbacteria bacterium]
MTKKTWIPAFAGMTNLGFSNSANPTGAVRKPPILLPELVEGHAMGLLPNSYFEISTLGK